jgi:hypothetical protein
MSLPGVASSDHTLITPTDSFQPYLLVGISYFGKYCQKCKTPLANTGENILLHYYNNKNNHANVHWDVTKLDASKLIKSYLQSDQSTVNMILEPMEIDHYVILNEQPKKVYVCLLCGYQTSFSSRGNVGKHLKNVHNIASTLDGEKEFIAITNAYRTICGRTVTLEYLSELRLVNQGVPTNHQNPLIGQCVKKITMEQLYEMEEKELVVNNAIIFPPLDDGEAPRFLRYIEDCLPVFITKIQKQKRKVWSQSLDRNLEDDDDDNWGARTIQGDRIEIFLKNTDHLNGTPVSTALWEYIGTKTGGHCTETTSQKFWAKIFEFAITSAKQDTRVPNDHQFGPFSLICSNKYVPGQVPHLDVLWPNFQYTLMVSDETPGTLVFNPIDSRLVSDVSSFVEWIGAGPDSQIGKLLSDNSDQCELLKTYGAVLVGATKGKLQVCVAQTEKLKRGTTMSIPGSLIHAGPSFSKFRAMLFFISHPTGKEEEAYISENQYSHGLVLINIVTWLFSCGINNREERILLLQKLHDSANDYQHKLHLHILDHHCQVYRFLYEISQIKDDRRQKQFIESFADEMFKPKEDKKRKSK